MERVCNQCGAKLGRYNPGELCHPCQEERREKIASTPKSYYDVKDLMEILGLDSEEQVRRLGREGLIPGRIPGIKAHRYIRDEVDKWIRSECRPVLKPTSPLQKEAYELCVRKDHSWLHDDRFDGAACTTEPGDETGDYTVSVGYRRTCYFCGHSEIVPV